MTATTTAADDVLRERRRQIEAEGWTPEHDDEHADGSMATAAACYALGSLIGHDEDGVIVMLWPWDPSWWKPRDTRTNLVRAAALLLAEIERLDRIKPANAKLNGGPPGPSV